jgi:putative phosphoesterase
MKIAIVSDTHDNLVNFKKAISKIKKEEAQILIHCGDILKPETIKEALENFPYKAHFILSENDKSYFENLDATYFKEFLNLKIWEGFGEIEADAKKIAFCHLPKIAFKKAFSRKYDVIFYGHSHKPWKTKIGKTLLINPGNLAGLFFRATFALFDLKTGELKLKILN